MERRHDRYASLSLRRSWMCGKYQSPSTHRRQVNYLSLSSLNHWQKFQGRVACIIDNDWTWRENVEKKTVTTVHDFILFLNEEYMILKTSH